MSNKKLVTVHDKEPDQSVNDLKRQRLRWKYAERDAVRKAALQYLNAAIAYKQSLYFTTYQWVKKFQWGKSLRR